MLCQTSVFTSAMILAALTCTVLGIFALWPYPLFAETLCPDGRSCPPAWSCCQYGCCSPPRVAATSAPGRPQVLHYQFAENWPILFLAGLLIGVGLCVAARLCCRSADGRRWWCAAGCARAGSERDSAASGYPPPRYSRCGSFLAPPPPYNEVTSKPDLYPVVLAREPADYKAGNFLVHYFRNYVLSAPATGSLSATSTADSLNSSYLCNAANEANSIIPPPYSCASNYDEWRGGGGGGGGGGGLLRSLSSLTEPSGARPPPRSRTAPPARPPRDPDTFINTLESPLELEMADYEPRFEGGRIPRLGRSPPPAPRGSPPAPREALERVRRLYAAQSAARPTRGQSPPLPTSPTDTHRKKRKASLYMPLVAHGRGKASRSAPATPCGALGPALLALTRGSSARSTRLEESDPLLDEPTDHKF